MAIVTLKALECDRCGYQWLPRGGLDEGRLPGTCSNCRSPYWNSGPASPRVGKQPAQRAKRPRNQD
jgi:hypothetical protein